MITVPVTVEAKVFIDEDDLKMLMEDESISEEAAIEKLAMAQVPDGDDAHAFKIHTISVLTHFRL